LVINQHGTRSPAVKAQRAGGAARRL